MELDVDACLFGRVFSASADAAYPRALDESPMARLPFDTWAAACVPAGVRIELEGHSDRLEVNYRTTTDELGYRGAGAGTTFDVYRGANQLVSIDADLGEGRVEFVLPAPATGTERTVIYLPEGMRPEVLGISTSGGTFSPAGRQPLCLVYGDSIAEGWCASGPALAWPSQLGRLVDFDVVNLGYAGAARGEIVSAEHLAALGQPDAVGTLAGRSPVAAIIVAHGTNCWSRVAHSAELFSAVTAAFVDVVRRGHPGVAILGVSPVLRPDAENTQNSAGATLRDLRAAFEESFVRRGEHDRLVSLLPGEDLVSADLLVDGVHPGDLGHERIASAVRSVLV